MVSRCGPIRHGLLGFGDQGTGPSFASARIDYYAGDKVERLPAKKISGGNTVPGPLLWAGPQDQYFAAIFLPDQPHQAAMVTFHDQIEVPKDPAKPDPNNLTKVDMLGAAVGDLDGITRERLFVGAKGAGCSQHRSYQHAERRGRRPGPHPRR